MATEIALNGEGSAGFKLRVTFEPNGSYTFTSSGQSFGVVNLSNYTVNGLKRWLIACGDGSINKALPEYAIPDARPIHDPVNSPKHYTDGGIETIDYIEAKQLGFHAGQVVKYVSRAGKKDIAPTLQDLEKAQWYLNRLIEKTKAKTL